MLSLKSVHIFFIAVAIVVTAGLGMWGLLHGYRFLGAASLLLGVLLVIYEGYFGSKAERIHLD